MYKVVITLDGHTFPYKCYNTLKGANRVVKKLCMSYNVLNMEYHVRIINKEDNSIVLQYFG